MLAFRHSSLSVPAERVWLDGVLGHAPDVRGIVVFVQNGCVLHADLREAMIARRCEEARIATLSIDLLTRYEEQRDPDARYNVPLMSGRLVAIVDWFDHQPGIGHLPLALAASGTPCAAAVRAAARLPERVSALLCRGGRPDLAGGGPLRLVKCPTRFIVGAQDAGCEHYQKAAFDHLAAVRDWQTLADADADFRAPGTLEQAAQLTVDWLVTHFPEAPALTQSATDDAPEDG